MMSTNTVMQLDEVELTIDDILAAIGDGKRALSVIGIIPCICCRCPFQSRGAHNRICELCRSTAPDSEMTGYEPHPGYVDLWKKFLIAAFEQGMWSPPDGMSVDDVVDQTTWTPPEEPRSFSRAVLLSGEEISVEETDGCTLMSMSNATEYSGRVLTLIREVCYGEAGNA